MVSFVLSEVRGQKSEIRGQGHHLTLHHLTTYNLSTETLICAS